MICLHFLIENFDWSKPVQTTAKRFSDADGCNYDWFPLCDLFLFINISQPSQVYVSQSMSQSQSISEIASRGRLGLIQVETS